MLRFAVLGWVMPSLTEEQRIAVETVNSPLLVSASAGSGKTSVLVERYLNLLRQGLKPREILAVTFTVEAAEELRERILCYDLPEKTAGEVRFSPHLGTIHSFCYGILEHYGSVLNLKPIEKILSAFEFQNAFHHTFEDWLQTLDTDSLKFLLNTFTHLELFRATQSLFNQRTHFKDSMEGKSCPEGVTKLWDTLSPFFKLLETQFISKGIYSFDDLETYALRILQQSEEISQLIRSRIRSVMVDEFQDTSRQQWKIIEHVVRGNPEKLFMVGDPLQSIYRFRNADVTLFLELEKKLGGSVKLTTNFRTQGSLLSEINRIAQSLFQDSRVSFTPMVASRTENTEAPFSLVHYHSGEVEAVVARVQAQLARGYLPEQISLLFRVSDRIPLYLNALEAAGIPADGKKTNKLFEMYDVIDIVHFLKVVHQPQDDFAFASFLRSPYGGFTAEGLWKLKSLPGKSLFEKLMTDPDQKLKWLCSIIDQKNSDTHEALCTLFRETRRFPFHGDALLAFLEPLTEDSNTLSDVLLKIDRWEKGDIVFQSESRGTRGVRLMTVHAAKGLEFPHVFLVDTLRQMPRKNPAILFGDTEPPALKGNEAYSMLKDRQEKEEWEETKRILYVALTRAKESLTIFVPKDAKAIPKSSWASFFCPKDP